MSQNLESARHQMIFQQVRAWEVLNPAVLQAMNDVPRERFVPEAYRNLAFADTVIPIGEGQHMMSPQVEGRILQALEVAAGNRVLEVGTGTGYVAACLAALGASVLSLEIRPGLAETARRTLHATGAGAVEVRVADVFAFEPEGSFDCIAVGGSLPLADERFERWLAPGGRLFVVTGEGPAMTAWIVRKDAAGAVTRESLFETVLDPLDHAPLPARFTF